MTRTSLVMTVERHSGLILVYKIVKNTMPENISSWITRTSLAMTGAAAFEIRAGFRRFKHASTIVITRFTLVIHLPICATITHGIYGNSS